jgi:large subunit ribosomal protein L35
MGNKLKTRKAAAKRFKVTATGKLMHRCLGLNHLMRKKGMAARRRLLKGSELDKANTKRVNQMLGEGH